MKLNLQVAFLSLLLFSSHAIGQISITAADIWVIGDSIPRELDTLTSFQPGPDGPNQTWDFSGAVPRVYQATKVMSPSSTPYGSSFTTSNQAMTTNDSLYLYFNTNSSRVLAKGTAGMGVLNTTVTTFNFPLNPDLLTDTFPINYGNHFTDTYGYDAIVNGAAYSVYQLQLKHFGTVYDTITGWGTVKTNVGTYNCLKQKVVEHKIDSTFYQLFSFTGWTLAGATDTTTISYSWLAKETKLAVVELAFDSVGNPKQLTWSLLPPLSTGVSQVSGNKSPISIFPNPTSDQLRIIPSDELNSSSFSIRIFNLIGEEVYQTRCSSFTKEINIDVSKFNAGEYFVEASAENGSGRYQEIFSVIH